MLTSNRWLPHLLCGGLIFSLRVLLILPQRLMKPNASYLYFQTQQSDYSLRTSFTFTDISIHRLRNALAIRTIKNVQPRWHNTFATRIWKKFDMLKTKKNLNKEYREAIRRLNKNGNEHRPKHWDSTRTLFGKNLQHPASFLYILIFTQSKAEETPKVENYCIWITFFISWTLCIIMAMYL